MPTNLRFIFILISFLCIDITIAKNELPKLKGILKTVYVGKYDVIDCFDIYQQPAFDHPLLKDHKIQMLPPKSIRPESNASDEHVIYQTWNGMVDCPEGTVPIMRHDEVDEELIMKMKRGSIYSNVSNAVSNQLVHEYATVQVDEGTYYGTKFATTLWNPHVEPNEFSLAQTWIVGGPGNAPNTIEVGWMVYPGIYGDFQTRLFIFSTTDGYKSGCYNVKCPGFVQLSRNIFPGAPISPVSQYGSQSKDVTIAVYKAQGNWNLQINGEMVGYWPAKIFPLLGGSANHVAWGGEIINRRSGGHHTTTQMGSGHFADEKYSKAAAIYNILVNTREDNPAFQRPRAINPLTVSNGNCYSLLRAQYSGNYGDHFFYGGPGYSSSCP